MLLPLLAGQMGGLNMFAYALNNPVMYWDPSGQIAITLKITGVLLLTTILKGLAVGALVVGAAVVIYHGVKMIMDAVNNRPPPATPAPPGMAPPGSIPTVVPNIITSNIALMGSNQGVSDMGRVHRHKRLRDMTAEELADEYAAAIARGDRAFARKVAEQQKYRGFRNRRKQRGQPNKIMLSALA